MSFSVVRLKNSLLKINGCLKSSEIDGISAKKKIFPGDVNDVISILGKEMLKNPDATFIIRDHIQYLIFPIVCTLLNISESNFQEYQTKCIILSILSEKNAQVLGYSRQYFTLKNSSPFAEKKEEEHQKKKIKLTRNITDLQIVQMCLRFLKLDSCFYRRIWDWSLFFELYSNKGCKMQQLYCNKITSIIFGLSNHQLEMLNKDIPVEICIDTEINARPDESSSFPITAANQNHDLIEWKYESDIITDIEGVYLPIYKKSIAEYYYNKLDIVKVSSTNINLRSLALGVSSGKAVCLCGPVGSGKTTLVEYLAKRVGRLPPKSDDIQNFLKSKEKFYARQSNGNKRKHEENDITEGNDNKNYSSGFLRIQLGDQTDSKVLLGQFRCTDVPGEFVWQPGILTEAVMNGSWLLLEDIDTASQDVCAILTNLLETNFLQVPGFRENLKISYGFQLFLTLRTQNHQLSNSAYSLLEKHLYTINMIPLSRSELSTIICQNYPKLSTVATRIVDVFLIFSQGNHLNEPEYDDIEMTGENHIKPDDYTVLPYANNIKFKSLPNSGRMISTRDLLKLCKRSDLTFNATSAECAFLVFQNCVDLFCSHLASGELKTNLIISIGARLGIIETRCIFQSNEYKPIIKMTSEEITIGRETLSRNSKEMIANGKRSKVNEEENEFTIANHNKIPQPTFSFTRVSSCILERISVAVAQNEPILLVGETGTGKTSSVQYLAYQTNHNLVVVNMNNQSDVSDLVGGYKPVDMHFIISPIRNEFENLFGRTFDVLKNEKFLSHIASCCNRSDYTILIKLMLKVIGNAYKILNERNNTEDLSRWQNLERKLKKLEQQLKHSINLSFAFIPGSLVNCIKNGDWVLLDEINLASTETLECLSTILEVNGSIILLERGDFVPVKRHPNFRIFACMNPSTDVGKKDLPVGIRNRFTEFFVDELSVEKDLLILVGDYLSNTGIEKSRIHKTVQLYMDLRNLSQLELNDGLGNKPVFSLRTLCRTLTTCAKNLCGSTERNLYESFCLSFLTQLDSQSHKVVLQKIQSFLVSDVKKILSQQIPKPLNSNALNFEGFWIEKGEKEVSECKEYIITNSVQNNLKDLARIISIGKLPILIQGPTSAGKTSLIEYIAKRSGNHCLRINNHEHTDLQEYVGTYVADVTGKLSFQEGVLVKAMRNGYWIILDELNLAPSDILEALNRVLDDNRELYIPETQVLVKAHPNFMLFATQNPPGIYGGRKTLSRAFKNRFIELHFSEIPKTELEVILEKRCMIPMKYAQKMVKTMSALQVNRRTTTRNNFTLRDLFRWGNRYTFADNSLLDDRNYDWNQHLVDEGFLVLSAKVRSQTESDIIAETLKKNFSKDISIDSLFSLSEKTSKVTKNILVSLLDYTGPLQVVWTFEMRRMAVMVSKSFQFNEPVLLVGPTGCGKTTICQLLSELHGKNLRILNCHMHTESADFIGGLRPCRDSKEKLNKEKAMKLFEWSDGPLIFSMLEGGYFLADEISLAEDSVLERLNCVLEPERTILLAEKGGINENVLNDTENSEFVIKASDGFQFLGTMNPSGDYGKKELSPALRNRFTEIWCSSLYSDEDLMKIAINLMEMTYKVKNELINNIAQIIVKVVNFLKKIVERLNFSIRDILAYVNYITQNYNISDESKSNLDLISTLVHGFKTIFLDYLEMLPFENANDIVIIREQSFNMLQKTIKEILQKDVNFTQINAIEESDVELNLNTFKFGINPFYLDINQSLIEKPTNFSFTAPTTKQNLFRVLSAMSLKKAILLEGAPGVGKSSLIENISSAIGYNLVRINLCEHTDIADLFGTDLPVESSIFENENCDAQLGSFIWRDGPLLAALKSPNTWILLDELNLAPQSVLEGLNAILDHRGEVYITELNKTFKLGQSTRIFATQNPLRQGGGRKGLPQSFLNRFTKVYLRKLEKRDLLHVVNHNFKLLNENQILRDFRLTDKMVTFSERIEQGIVNFQFGTKGGPFEANLRDMLRWCEFITNNKIGYDINQLNEKTFGDFQLVLFEKMKLVYCDRMRTQHDVESIMKIFGDIFKCNVNELEKESCSIGFYWNDSSIFFSDIKCTRNSSNHTIDLNRNNHSIILSSQLKQLKSLTECVMLEKPLILSGSTDCGKTKIIDTFCEIYNEKLNFDTIDDSITGSFQQFDFNRMLEEMWASIEEILLKKIVDIITNSESNGKTLSTQLYKLWRDYDINTIFNQSDEKFNEVEHFCKRLELVKTIIKTLRANISDHSSKLDDIMKNLNLWNNFLLQKSSSLNTGGHFVWIDSMIVKSIKFGHYICLEHVNLVSSAILDRLNPILEPNGTLMIAEKGVDDSNQPERIHKHDNFRMFLTTDPKFGEISRAMRNRCIEIALPHQNYSEDDLRKLIFLQGVHEMYLIRAIIDIHKNLCKLNDFSTFGVSHIVKTAFLVAQNKSMGLEDKKCLIISASEVYVRGSNIDLLGFGLDFYRSKLRQQIVEIVNYVKPSENIVNYDNLIIRSNNLSEMSMMKYQAEPFLTLLRCNENKDLKASDALENLHTILCDLELTNIEKSMKYLLTFLYMLSTFSDIQKRKIYLGKSICGINKSQKLMKLNENLSEIIVEFSSQSIQQTIPWNSKMFNRLRDNDSKLNETDEFRIILLLIVEMTLNEVCVGKSVASKDLDSISYSRAVQMKLLADTINNKMIAELYNLLSLFKNFVQKSLKSKDFEIQENIFTKLISSFLWFNRFLDKSMQKLFERNDVKTDLLDELYLHFKWLSKHCVNYLKEFNLEHSFMTIFNEIQNFIIERHTLQMYKKIYVKNFSWFMPFYNESQIKRLEDVEQLNESTLIIPHMNELLEFEEYQNRLLLMMNTQYQQIRKELSLSRTLELEELFKNFSDTWNDEMKKLNMYESWIESFSMEPIVFEDRNSLQNRISELRNRIEKDGTENIRIFKYELEILPVCEYFLMKILSVISSVRCTINEEYLLSIPSVNSNTLFLSKIYNDKRYKIIVDLPHIMENLNISNDFKKKLSSFQMALNSISQESIHKSLLINSELCRTYDQKEKYTVNTNALFVTRGLLTYNIMSFLFGKNGDFRQVGLGDVYQWKSSLWSLQKMLWLNAEVNGKKYDILRNNLIYNKENAKQLLTKIDVVKNHCQSIENKSYSDFNQEFWNLEVHLKDALSKESEDISTLWLQNYKIQTLCSIMLINLNSYFPLIDPVKKNILKTNYIKEDLDHLNQLLLSYKIMATILEYDNLGKQNRDLIEKEVLLLKSRHLKYSIQTALRPNNCLYSSMVRDINHFLSSFCHPKQLFDLISKIEEALSFKIDSKSISSNQLTERKKLEIGDLVSKLELWIINADKFLGHTLKNYDKYYRDFTAPIHYSVTSLKDGLLGLGSLLRMKNDSIRVTTNGVFWNCNENNEMTIIMKELIEFPIRSSLKSFTTESNLKNTLFSIMESIEDGENLYFTMIKSNILEISNLSATLSGKLTSELFEKFDSILNICNQMWQKQEELRAKRQAEEDSLYVTKTKCKDEDEEALKIQEISEMFPDNADNDFDDFLQKDTLEQKLRTEKPSKNVKDILREDEYKMIGDFFMRIMSSESKVLTKDFIAVFNHRVKIFNVLLECFKNCIDCSIDVDSYNSLSLLIGLSQDTYDENQWIAPVNSNFNFYKDSSIQEALTCIDVMNKLEKRVYVELEQWPDHAVLNDLIVIIKRIRSFSSDSPLVRFNVGMQILRKKIHEWNSVAHKLNNLKDIECEIAEIIQKWMRMELQCWREALYQAQKKAEGRSYRYWFFLYNLIHEFLQDSSKTENESSLVDFNNVEKRFGREEITTDQKSFNGQITIKAVTNVLKQFIESSSYAEFSLRMNLIKSFKEYLSKFKNVQKNSRHAEMIAVLHNLHQYFTQFGQRIHEYIDSVRKPIEDKLKKFVKINSFNKDLSYFSTEANIKQVHRNLHKFLKEFEVEICKRITDLFIYKDSGLELDKNQYISLNMPLSTLSMSSFIGNENIEKEINASESDIPSFNNINKFILKSRSLVETSLSNAQYQKLIDDLNNLIENELERCNDLRSMKVDENLPRNKQKSQAKSILNQKRKALSDFFKTMMNIGVNYKSGLLLETLHPEQVDLKIPPFSVENLKFSNADISKTVNATCQKLNLYYNKSIFKMKLLKNILLAPRSDIDINFIDRIKGISIELFSFMQNERKNLSENVNFLTNLTQQMQDIEIAIESKNTYEKLCFKNESRKFSIIQNFLTHSIEILEQFQMLLKCAPKNDDSKEHKVISSTNNVLYKRGQIYVNITSKTDELLAELNTKIFILNSHQSRFVNNVDSFYSYFKVLRNKLCNLKEYFAMDNEYSVYGKSICDLISALNLEISKIESINQEVFEESLNVKNDLEQLSCMMLLAIQNIYKEYREIQIEISKTDSMEQNHFKEKIHRNLMRDTEIINLKKINEKLLEIMNSIFTSTSSEHLNNLRKVYPLINQYKLLAEYFIIQCVNANKTSSKMLSIMLSVFLELAKNGFCIPENLLSDEEQNNEKDTKTGEGFGFEDGEGEKDVSDKLESEDQLDEAKKAEDYNKGDQDEKECKEEKGIDMSDNFEGKMHDIPENESDSENEQKDNDDEEMDKEMGETNEGADKLDDQIWGSDEEDEKEQEEQEKQDETGKGSDEKGDKHNDLEAENDRANDKQQEEQSDGLDAASQMDNEKRKEHKKDIENMNDQDEESEEHTNPYHNQLEEPPEPEDFDLNDEINLDNNEKGDEKEPTNEENPFDIDKMKEQIENEAEDNDESEQQKTDNNDKIDENDSDKGSDNENETETMDIDEQDDGEQEIENEDNEDETIQQQGMNDSDENKQENEKENDFSNDFKEAEDKQSKEKNIQSMPNLKKDQKSSSDQVEIDNTKSNQQENEIDDQDTGEDQEGIGQAENKESQSGHHGVSETKESNSNRNCENDETQQKRKQGNTDKERTLGNVDDLKKKFLKTIDKINEIKNNNEEEDEKNQNDDNGDEYQHVKDAKKSDKTTMDNATEEQSKETRHEDSSNKNNHDDFETQDELIEENDKEENPEMEDVTEEMKSKKIEEKSKNPSKNNEQTKDRLNDQNQEGIVEGENVPTSTVSRGNETTAHCQIDIVTDSTQCEDQSAMEELEIRKNVESEMLTQKAVNPNVGNMEDWQRISNQMVSNARELCEQLRLILEPTKCTRLKGDYRTGRRINMKKIIPYIASQFRKDKIWLRRTKAAQRDYKITIAVDDSKSMDHNNSKELTLQTISLVSQALTLLESGKLSVVSFGEATKILLKYNEQFDGPKLINSLNFDQNKTKIAELLDFARVMNQDDLSSSSSLFEHLLIILSDGRNIFSEGEKRVRNAIKMARLQRIFLIYIIIDNPDNKDSILDIKTVLPFTATDKSMKIVSYMDNFPFPYYVIVRDLNQLPIVLSEGLRQWFELVNSEQ